MAKLLDKLYNRVIEGKLTLSEDEVKELQQDIEELLKDSDLNVKSINAKGGAISGPLVVTGNTAIGGDLQVNGTLDGTLKQGPIAVFRENVNVRKDFEVSRRIGDLVLYQLKITTTGGNLAQGTKFADFEYQPSSHIYLTSASVGGAIRSLQIGTDGVIENIQEISNNYTLTYFAIIQIQD